MLKFVVCNIRLLRAVPRKSYNWELNIKAMSNIRLSDADQEDLPKDFGVGGFMLLLLLVAAVWALAWFLMHKFIPNSGDRGTFGDMFGSVNAFFSGAALAGVIYTIALQRRELQLQRHELQLTRQELRRSAETQEKSEAALNEQARILQLTAKLTALNFIPALSFSVGKGEDLTFSLSNLGNTPAYDVDVIAIGYYPEYEISAQEFATAYVKKSDDHIDRILNTDEEAFGVYDHITYASVPRGRRVRSSFAYPIQPEGMYVLLQFRDIQGNNYHHLYWMFKNSEQGYRVGALDPKSPQIVPRIDWDLELILRTEDNSPLPVYMKEFESQWNTSISTGYTTLGMAEIEDRGSWEDI